MNISEEVKSKVSIPKYFYEIIIPQMAEYYSDYPVEFELKPVCKCPLHDEDTPSMRYYEETNTFYCFGCGAGGDVIELHRKFIDKITGNRPTFSESVKFLYGYFIQGNSEETEIKQLSKRKKTVENVSTNIELMTYSRYINMIEQALLSDNYMNLNTKKKIWGYVDEVKILVSLNRLNATKGMESIKQFIREQQI